MVNLRLIQVERIFNRGGNQPMVDLEIRKLLKIWRMEIPDKAH